MSLSSVNPQIRIFALTWQRMIVPVKAHIRRSAWECSMAFLV